VQHNDYVLAEIAQRVESKELGITCGYADRYVPLFGGLAYLDYRGKLYQTALNEEPYVTYERLDPYAGHLPLVIIYSGIKHDSGDIHERMRPRFIQEYQDWQLRGGSPPEIVHLMIKTWETAWRGKIALLGGDQQRLGNLMNENHIYVNQMMKICGLEDGAGLVNNLLVEAALQNGALGAKLTGAGGGGSVYALVKPGQENRIIQTWQQEIQAHNLDSARIFTPRISTDGLVVENILD
jgi:galactokinase/mevalonate kinase-like predicted kinase